MNLWGDTEHQLARIWLLGLLACFFACFQIVINSLFKCCSKFTNSFTVKAYDITNACNMANKATIFIAVFNAGTIALVFHRFHCFTPACFKKERASRIWLVGFCVFMGMWSMETHHYFV